MLEIRQIGFGFVVAQHGHLAHAREVSAMSPSALTRAVPVIEDKLSPPLFDRSRRDFKPPPLPRNHRQERPTSSQGE